ncbi:uracil phosphoribosyltransferase [Paenibacillus sp. RC67]|uniref:uracil phosphoribosyltransferase n=1 Tax=Paenibacillus sp. RC67 TaxID=3039392 RepID=UPI0024AE571A|nr:uracil phosphoribosyltransferase [Paenibacillus sp. RC67]
MAQSKAKKERCRIVREGGLNPELQRLHWNGVIPVERKTPTLSEKQERLQRKHKQKWNRTLQSSDGSILRSGA